MTKQRERAGIKTESLFRDEDRHYRDRRSPGLVYERQRSITPTRLSHYTGYDAYRRDSSPQALYEGSTRRPRLRSPRYESPPRVRRARKTRDHRENSPIRQNTDHYDPRHHKPPSVRIGDGHGDANTVRRGGRTIKSNEGRLSYDDDIYVGPQSPQPAPKAKKTKAKNASMSKTHDQILKGGDILTHEGPEPMLNINEVEQAKQDTDRLLRELEAEISAARSSGKNSPIHVPFEAAMLQGTLEDLDKNMHMDETNIHETNSPQSDEQRDDTYTVKDDSTSFEAPDGNRYRLVTETQFRPEILALFNSRANPIINNRSDRKAASQMWTFF